jgi:HSP20 family protein
LTFVIFEQELICLKAARQSIFLFDISVHGNTLTIGGEKKQEEKKKEKGYYHIERSYGSFRRDLSLPNDVDPAKIEAACKDGVLSINLPKAAKAKATKIKIKSE